MVVPSENSSSLPTLAVVIPALNEYPGIISVLKELLEIKKKLIQESMYRDVEIIVVDDGSTDETASAVSDFTEIKLLQHEENQGYGAALKSGFASTFAEHLSFLDADGTYPPAAIPELCATLIEKDCDIVVGSRLGSPSGMPAVRYLGNRIFSRLTSWASGKLVSDCASGMRIFKSDVLPRLYPLSDGLDFTPAMSTRAMLEGLSYIEVPISYNERLGDSKLSAIKDGFRFLGSILRMTTYYNPLKFFGLIGFFLLLLGMAYGLEPVLHYLKVQQVPEKYIYRLLGILTFWLSGLQIIAFGILANFILGIIHGYRSGQSRITQFFQGKTLLNRIDLLGYFFIITALVLNKSNIVEYFRAGQISGHWSYLVTGAILILTGIQLVTGHILIRILAELKQRDVHIARDLGKPH